MKRQILAGLIATAASAAIAQSHVSTDAQPRAALVEEYTGINCVFCPQAHNNARLLAVNAPGTAYTVAVHYGSYASPRGPESDFRTYTGSDLNNAFGIGQYGYPSVMVSRRQFPDSKVKVYSYSAFVGLARDVHKEEANVNVWCDATYDASTRDITINFEAYFRKEVAGAKLVGYLLQNNVKGPQTGAAQTGQTDSDYNHMHMLRDLLTGSLWGDDIDKCSEGDTWTTTITYNLPEEIKYLATSTDPGIPTKPEDMEIVLFILNADGEVENATGAHPALVGIEAPNKVRLSQPMLQLGDTWGFGFMDAVVDNYTPEELTNATFKLIIGTEEAELNHTFDTPLAPYESRLVSIPFPEGMRIERNSGNKRLRLEILTANGKETADKTYISGSTRGSKPVSPTFRLCFNADGSTPDATYKIRDFKGNTVKEFGPYGESTEKIDEIITLDDMSDYCFEALTPTPKGINTGTISISAEGSDTPILTLEPLNLGYYGGRLFFHTDSTAGADEITEDSSLTYDSGSLRCHGKTITVTDMAGKSVATGKDLVDVTSLPHGVYIATAGSHVIKIVR